MDSRYDHVVLCIYWQLISLKGGDTMQGLRHNKQFGDTLRSLRKSAGLTQEQTAAKLQLRGLDISRVVYAQIEDGVRNIRFEELAALREILGVPYEAFFTAFETE